MKHLFALLALLLFAGSGAIGQKTISLSPLPGDNYKQLQDAIDFAARNPGYSVALSPGVYSYTKPLVAAIVQGKDFAQVSFDLRGPQMAKNAPDTRLAVLSPTFNNAPALVIQKGKGVRIENIYFRGQFVLPNSLSPFAIQTMRYADWDDHRCRQNRYTPYAGIAIDPFSDPGQGFAEKYPGLESFYLDGMGRGGSTGVDIIGCRITNFPVGIAYESEAQQNGDMCNVIDCAVEYCRVGISYCQDQTKGNHIIRLRCWGNVHSLIDCRMFGRGLGTMPFIDGMNIAGGINQIFNCPSGRFTAGARNIYAEMIFKIGIIGGAQPPAIESSTFDFMDFGYQPDFIVFGNCIFRDCQFRYYNGAVNRINFAGFAGVISGGGSERPITKTVMNGGVGYAVPQFDQVTMMNENLPGGMPVKLGSNPGEQITWLGRFSLEPDPVHYTVSMPAAGLRKGDYVLAGEEPTKYFDSLLVGANLNVPTIVVGRVKSIEGKTAILDQVSILVRPGRPMQLYRLQ